jgi:hypothetical protein
MLCRETAAVYCENHTEHTNTPRGQNAEFLNVKAGGTYICVVELSWTDIRMPSATSKLSRTSLFVFNLTQVLLVAMKGYKYVQEHGFDRSDGTWITQTDFHLSNFAAIYIISDFANVKIQTR